MTRPKADSDPWLTDPIARDKVIAKTVVEGLRTIIGLLRSIRDEAADTNRALLVENREIRQQLMDLYAQRQADGLPATTNRKAARFNRCENEQCSLPQGHLGNHRGYMRPQV